MVKMLIVVVVVYSLCYFPLNVAWVRGKNPVRYAVCPKFGHLFQSSDINLISKNLNFCTGKKIVIGTVSFEIISAFGDLIFLRRMPTEAINSVLSA